MKAFLAVLGFLCLIASATQISVDVEAPPKGLLASVYRTGSLTNCSFIHINRTSGHVDYIRELHVCQDTDRGGSGLPKTAYNSVTRMFFFVTGTGSYIHAINVYTGTEFVYAPLPTSYDYLAGLFISRNKLYVVSASSLYLVSAGKVRPVMNLTALSLNSDTLVTADYGDLLFLVTDLTLRTIHVASLTLVSTVNLGPPLTFVMDFQYYDLNNNLVVLDHYKLYSLNQKTGATQFLLNIPDGSGFPRINTLFSSSFFFSDFETVYEIDLPSVKIIANASFVSVPCVGYFQFFS